MKIGLPKKLIIGAIGLSVFTGGVGVYAGTIIDRYKTPRGNIAIVEREDVHKNRIAISVNGKSVTADTIYFNNTTYAPIRDVATMLNASVNYDSKTMTGDIVTNSKLLELLGLKLNTTYYGETEEYGMSSTVTFKITHFNPSTNEFEGEYETSYNSLRTVKGKLSETDMVYFLSGSSHSRTLLYDGANNRFISEDKDTIINIK